jgi:hydrogenase expression/formation protein HypC
MGKVDFGGVSKRVCLDHVGMALARIDHEEARRVFDFLAGMEQLGELDEVP